MKRIGLICLVAGLMCSFSGCGTVSAEDDEAYKSMGIKRSEWVAMSKDHRQELIYQYSSNQAKWRRLQSGARAQGQRLFLHIEQGEAHFGPERRRDKIRTPVEFSMPAESCRQIKLQAKNQDDATKLQVCYSNGMLYIDPSPIDKKYAAGSVKIPINHILEKGLRFCELSSNGSVSLRNTCLTLRLSKASAAQHTWTLRRGKVSSRYKKYQQESQMQS